MAFPQGGGGGKAPGFTLNNAHALSKPYELSGEMTPEKTAQLDEMLQLLFDSMRFSASDISTLQTTVAADDDDGGAGDVVGPSSAVDDNVVTFDGTTGKLIQDSGVTISELTPVITGGFAVASVTLTHTDIQGLNTTPVTIVSAVADKIIVPFQFIMQQEIGGTLFNTPPTITLRYAAATAQSASNGIAITNTANVNKTSFAEMAGLAVANNTNVSNSDLVLRGSTDVTLGSGTFTFSVGYFLIDAVY